MVLKQNLIQCHTCINHSPKFFPLLLFSLSLKNAKNIKNAEVFQLNTFNFNQQFDLTIFTCGIPNFKYMPTKLLIRKTLRNPFELDYNQLQCSVDETKMAVNTISNNIGGGATVGGGGGGGWWERFFVCTGLSRPERCEGVGIQGVGSPSKNHPSHHKYKSPKQFL